jgi:hypothetical protein
MGEEFDGVPYTRDLVSRVSGLNPATGTNESKHLCFKTTALSFSRVTYRVTNTCCWPYGPLALPPRKHRPISRAGIAFEASIRLAILPDMTVTVLQRVRAIVASRDAVTALRITSRHDLAALP